MEDFVNEYYSMERFKNAYKRLIEPFPDKSQWPRIDLPSPLGAPLGKRSIGHQKKKRIKSAFEGGGGKKKEAVKEKKVLRGKYKCNLDIGNLVINVL